MIHPPAPPRLDVARLPTPIHRLERLSAAWGGPTLWVKRDDRSSSQYGGNKVRKLEYLLGDALSHGAGRLITTGVEGSHHCLATCVHGRRVGLPATLVVFPQPGTAHSREMAALNRAWADRVWVSARGWAVIRFGSGKIIGISARAVGRY